jgi:hypothetical protein
MLSQRLSWEEIMSEVRSFALLKNIPAADQPLYTIRYSQAVKVLVDLCG